MSPHRGKPVPSWRGRGGSSSSALVLATVDGTTLSRIPEPVRLQMQYLCTRIDIHEGGVPSSIAVTSAVGGEGVTFISRCLAAVLSEDFDRRTCLVGANWWSDDNETTSRNPGLAGLLQGRASVDDVLIEARGDRLSLIECGALPDRQRTILSTTNKMAAILVDLRTRFDQVILDLPAVGTSTSTLAFAAGAEATLLVARQRMVRVDQVERALDDLSHTRLLGLVMNDYQLHMPKALQRRLLDA